MKNNNGKTVVGPGDRICPICVGPKSAYAKKCKECFIMETREEYLEKKKEILLGNDEI